MSGKRLKGKVALITGAAKGIGKEIAAVFAREGAIVVITATNDESGRKCAEQIGENAVYFHLDVTQEDEWEKVTAKILKQFGHLDILVNNAGISGLKKSLGPQDPENATLDSWRTVHNVNIDGVFLGCKHGIRAMKESGNGSIINISSRSGLVGMPIAAAYAASKAAVRNHTKTVALYCCDQGYSIRCNSIHPASILTSMWEPMIKDGPDQEPGIEAITQNIPMKKMGKPEDVAFAALYLASDESKYVTGIELVVDGGQLAGSSSRIKQEKKGGKSKEIEHLQQTSEWTKNKAA